MKKVGGFVSITILLVVIAFAILLTGFFFNNEKSGTSNQPINGIIVTQTPNDARHNLQLNTFTFITVTPAPRSETTPINECSNVGYPNPTSGPTSNACGIADAPLLELGTNPDTGQCCVMDGPTTRPDGCCPGVGLIGTCFAGYTYWCDAKPVIYLYPERKTNVSVKVDVPGKITISIPEYSNGWDVVAYPNGTLVHNGRIYSELFYETVQERSVPPDYGIFVAKENLKQELTRITTALGLNLKEQGEFLDYWLKRLYEIEKPYVLVSYFSPEQKKEVDNVTIDPKPDVFINFIMYFKGVEKPYRIPQLKLPATPPTRHGFTAVEWGGILDSE